MAAPVKHHRSTRSIVVDERFAGLIAEDFGIPTPTILRALGGEPQREAIAVAEWAAEKTDDPAGALTAWAKKHGRGQYRKTRRNMTPAQTRAALDARAEGRAA